MNLLILSVGTRNKLLQYFKRSFAGIGNVVVADASVLAPALYEADVWYTVPPAGTPEYVEFLLEICRKERISGILSLIDPELSLLAANREQFAAVGTTVIGSDFALCETALDKRAMYRWLRRHNFCCAQTWNDMASFFQAVEQGAASYPVLMKPAFGSASDDVFRVCDPDMVSCLLSGKKDWVIQEYLAGQEIGADVYADMISGEVVSVFTKKKLRMRAGETDKSVSFKDPVLFDLIGRFVTEAGFCGPVDMDLFEVNGKYYISEVNPRFGGGYPHAHECGCDFTKLILNNLNGVANEPHIGDYEEGVYMMKYSDVMIRKETELTKQRGASVPL